jgi:hypothetical protein
LFFGTKHITSHYIWQKKLIFSNNCLALSYLHIDTLWIYLSNFMHELARTCNSLWPTCHPTFYQVFSLSSIFQSRCLYFLAHIHLFSSFAQACFWQKSMNWWRGSNPERPRDLSAFDQSVISTPYKCSQISTILIRY